MTVLSWNCRGIGQPRTVRELVGLVHSLKPKLVFLSETRQKDDYVNKLRWRLGLKHCIKHAGTGKSAGIALFYDENVEIKELAVGPRYIDVLIRVSPNSPRWRGTFVYGEPKAHERIHMWNVLRRLRPNASEPWLVIGDFNETMWQSEHFSKAKRSETNMANFRRVLSDCNLHDIGYKGMAWTYNNKQSGSGNVKARLDRAVATPEWSTAFRNATVEHIISARSDHVPVLLRLGKRKEWRPVKRSFRYEAMWERVESLPDTIRNAWERGGQGRSMEDVIAKLRDMQNTLSSWALKDFCSLQNKISSCRGRLKWLWNQTVTPEIERKIKITTGELDELLREEIMWKQRSRIAWLREGDKNTEFFHRKATWRRKKNKIHKLQGTDGSWIEKWRKYRPKLISFSRTYIPEMIQLTHKLYSTAT